MRGRTHRRRTFNHVTENNKTLHVRWIRSGIGFTRRQKQMVRDLGLRRLQQTVELQDTPSVRGLVAAIPHLVEIVEPAPPPAWLATPEYSLRSPEPAPASSRSALGGGSGASALETRAADSGGTAPVSSQGESESASENPPAPAVSTGDEE